MKSPKPPEPVDPYEAAEAQTGTNVGTAVANQLLGQTNKISPTGSLTYDKTGTESWTDPTSGKTFEIPRYTQTEKLSPAEQGLYDAQTRANTNLSTFAADQSQRLGGLLSKPIDLNTIPDGPGQLSLDRVNAPKGDPASVNLGNMGNNFNSDVNRTYGADDFSDDRRRVERAMMKRMEPDMSRDRARLDDNLANRGITLGSREYDRAMDAQSRSVNDARLATILAGGKEQDRLTGLERDQAVFENAATGQRFLQSQGQKEFNNRSTLDEAVFNQAALGDLFNQQLQSTLSNNNASIAENTASQNNRSNALQEAFSLRNQPINEIAALLGTGQVSMPQFANAPVSQMPTTDIAGLMSNNFNQQMQNYNATTQANNNRMGGLFGIGNAVLGGVL